MWQAIDSQILHGDNVGRSCCGTSTLRATTKDVQKSLVVVWDDNANAKGRSDKEERETDICDFERGLQVSPWKFDFSSKHREVFWSDHGECSAPEAAEKAFESTKRPCGDVFGEGTWSVPIPKLEPYVSQHSGSFRLRMAYSIGVFLWIAANHRNERERIHDQDEEDLPESKPEFGFTIPLDHEGINAADIH